MATLTPIRSIAGNDDLALVELDMTGEVELIDSEFDDQSAAFAELERAFDQLPLWRGREVKYRLADYSLI
jgi:hypothetical protein